MIDRERVKQLFTALGEQVAGLPESEISSAIEGMIDGSASSARDPFSLDDDDRVTVCRVCGGVEGCANECAADALWQLLLAKVGG